MAEVLACRRKSRGSGCNSVLGKGDKIFLSSPDEFIDDLEPLDGKNTHLLHSARLEAVARASACAAAA